MLIKRVPFFFVILVSGIFTTSVYARWYPVFRADAVWLASNVVIVSEGTTIDGKVIVIKTIVGDIREGTTLNIPALCHFKTEESRFINYKKNEQPKKGLPKLVSSQRIILMLNNTSEHGQYEGQEFIGAIEKGDMRASAVFIEKNRVYAFHQRSSPGRSKLIPYGLTEAQLLVRLKQNKEKQSILEDIAENPDMSERVRQAFVFINDRNFFASSFASEIISECSTPAIVFLTELVNNPESSENILVSIRLLSGFQSQRDEIFSASQQRLDFTEDKAISDACLDSMVEIGGELAGPALLETLENLILEWEIKKGNPDPDLVISTDLPFEIIIEHPELNKLTDELAYKIYLMKECKYRPGIERIQEFCDDWSESYLVDDKSFASFFRSCQF